jgi:hypothetical protein
MREARRRTTVGHKRDRHTNQVYNVLWYVESFADWREATSPLVKGTQELPYQIFQIPFENPTM